MSKPLSSYPLKIRESVIARRMRNYNPKGPNGLGTLSAKAAYDKKMEKRVKGMLNESTVS